MSSFIYRTRGIVQFPRYVPTLIARAQASQSNPPTPGSGVPMSGSTKTVSQSGGTKKGDSSVLPSSSTSKDNTNPTKTSSDAPPLSHETVDLKNKEKTSDKKSSSSSSSSSKDSDKKESFLSSPIGQFGTIAILAGTIYAGYKMMSGDKKDSKMNEHYKRATADYQAANAQGTDVKK